MCSVKPSNVRRFQIAAIQGLIVLGFGMAAASDISAQEGASRENAQLDKGDAKSGPNPRVRVRRRTSESEKQFSYKEWRLIKLPWEPNAPGG